MLHARRAPTSVVFESIHLLSQLARASVTYYAPIASAAILPELRALLYHSSATIRAKVCHLVGNLCRHSAFFYTRLGEQLPPLTADSPMLAPAHLPLPAGAQGTGVGAKEGGGADEPPQRARHDLLYHVICACKDPDSATRKFACFAVGNACFHSSRLYVTRPPPPRAVYSPPPRRRRPSGLYLT